MDASQPYRSTTALDEALCVVRGVLLALDLPELTSEQIQPASLLVEELGVDSLRFVDLTVGLEDAFGFAEFPMQRWVDERLEHGEQLTVGALVEACQQLLAGDCNAPHDPGGKHT